MFNRNRHTESADSMGNCHADSYQTFTVQCTIQMGDVSRYDSRGHGWHGVYGPDITNVVSRVLLLPSYTADKINPFKLGALLQKHGDHKRYDG